jgi:hypothetical protein
MRNITKDISLKIDGQDLSFCLIKLDAFSGVVLLRLRRENENRAADAARQGKGDKGR